MTLKTGNSRGATSEIIAVTLGAIIFRILKTAHVENSSLIDSMI
jgi:hypothetical protein